MQPPNETPSTPAGNVEGLAKALAEEGYTPGFVRSQAPGNATWEEIAAAMETASE